MRKHRTRLFPRTVSARLAAACIGVLPLVAGCDRDSTAPPPQVTTVAVTPGSGSVLAGDTTTFTATVLDASGQPLENRTIVWTSSDPAVAEVAPNGLARGLAAGSALIRATVENRFGEATLTVQRPPFLARFEALAGDTLTVVALASNGVADPSAVAGVLLRLNDLAGTLTLTFFSAARAQVGGPIELAPDPASLPGQFRMKATNVSLFGHGGLTVLTWVLDPPLGETRLAIAFDSRPDVGHVTVRSAPNVEMAAGPEDRLGFIERWQELSEDPTITDLDRWGQLVQHIIDVNLPGATDEDDFARAVTDDMVDIFINDPYYRSKLISGQSVLVSGQFIADPGALTGFAPMLRKGDGRFRHFSANAALVAMGVPHVLVDLGGRIEGGDFNPENDPTGDIAADLKTNEIGRRFPDELKRLWARRDQGAVTERIDDGTSVRRWLLAEFGPGVASVVITPDPLPSGSIGESSQLTATTLDSDGNVLTGYPVAWASSDPEILAVDDNGLMTRTGPGTAAISATAENGAAGTMSVSVPDILVVTGPAAIAFEHTVGVTECLQQIATLTVTNTIDESVQWSVAESASGGVVRIEGAPYSGTLAGRGSVAVTVVFRCNTMQSFTSSLEIRGTTGPQGRQVTILVPVTGTIDATPGTLTVTTATSGPNLPDTYRVHDVELGTDIGTIGPNETKEFTDVRPGSYPVRLILPPELRCSGDGDFIRDVVIPAGGTGSVMFDAECEDISLVPGLHRLPILNPYRVFYLGRGFAGLSTQLGALAFAGGHPDGGGSMVAVDPLTSEVLAERRVDAYMFGATGARLGAGQYTGGLMLWGTAGYSLFTQNGPLAETPTEARADIRISDAVPAGGGGPSEAIVFTSRDLGIGFVRYDPALGRFAVSDEVLPASAFFGELNSAYIHTPTGPAVVLARAANSRFYYHARGGGGPVTVAADLGSPVNGMRCLPPICVIFGGGGTVPVFLFDGQNLPVRVANAQFDFMPIHAALGSTANGGVAGVFIGTGRAVEVEFDASGAVIQTFSIPVPPACSGLGGVSYVPDPLGAGIVVTCTSAGRYFLERSRLYF